MRHVALTVGCLVVFASGLAVAQQHNMPAGKMTDEEIIKSAMSAAPEAIGKGATIIDVGSDGKIRVVRQGSNQFTCMADAGQCSCNWSSPLCCRSLYAQTPSSGLSELRYAKYADV